MAPDEAVLGGGTLSASESEGSDEVSAPAAAERGAAEEDEGNAAEDAEINEGAAPATDGDEESESAAGAPADEDDDVPEPEPELELQRAAARSSLKFCSWHGVIAVLAANWCRPSK